MKRDIVREALAFRAVAPVPHYFSFTIGARKKLEDYYGDDFPGCLNNYMSEAAVEPPGAWREIEKDVWADEWGVEWDRSVDKDIGVPRNQIFPEADMKYWNPPPIDGGRYGSIPKAVAGGEGTFIMAGIGFSLYERAWTLRGLQALLMDFVMNPGFVHDLLDAIADWNVQVVRKVLQVPGIDAVHFGDDWGTQRGLVMGPELWKEFIGPRVKRMYGTVKEGGKFCSQHSCGMVQELFPDLVEYGLNMFNPFQPEVMDVHEMHAKYFGKLAFWGGVSVQETLPHGTPDDVRREVLDRIEMGKRGGYILTPSHAVPGDAPVENLVAMIETVRECEA
ncbi:MAG: uroporphyrinogen-III decarboxylase-like protein [Planctomycetes bacterium]|nr:uroporphyrinogen-III decarboxylase-like protein [Planctomycetota bacterium]